jgi:hypothetical protein
MFPVRTDDSNPSFREIPQLDWFTSAMPLLRTKYSDSLVAGLVISIGSSIPSVVSTSPRLMLRDLMSSQRRVYKPCYRPSKRIQGYWTRSPAIFLACLRQT